MQRLNKIELLEQSKRIIDNELKKSGDSFLSTLSMYELLERNFKLVAEYYGKPEKLPVEGSSQWVYDMSQHYRYYVSETMRWIKGQIAKQHPPIDSILEERKQGRRWLYRYIQTDFSIYDNNIPLRRKLTDTDRIKELFLSLKRRKTTKNNSFDIPVGLTSYSAVLSEYQLLEDRLHKLKDDAIDDIFMYKYNEIIRLYYSEAEDAKSQIIKLLDEGLSFISNNTDETYYSSYYIGLSYLALRVEAYTEDKRIEMGRKSIEIFDNLKDENIKNGYLTSIAMIYVHMARLIPEDDNLQKDKYLETAFKLIDDKKDSFVDDDDFNLSYLYVANEYGGFYAYNQPQRAVKLSDLALRFAELRKMPPSDWLIMIMCNLYFAYWIGLGNDLKAEETVRKAIDLAKNIEPQNGDSQFWLPFLEDSLQSILKLKDDI